MVPEIQEVSVSPASPIPQSISKKGQRKQKKYKVKRQNKEVLLSLYIMLVIAGIVERKKIGRIGWRCL